MPRKTTKPAPPAILTPEQIAAQEARKTRDDAHQDAREALLAKALTFARRGWAAGAAAASIRWVNP